jgi:hypothetical protein
MKTVRTALLSILVVAAVMSTGCFNVEMVAPYGMDVTLMSSDAPAEVERRWRTWYVIFGISPLDDTMPVEYIQREQLTEVRLITEDNIPDALHGFFYNVIVPIGLVNQTLVLQGNRAPAAPEAAASNQK